VKGVTRADVERWRAQLVELRALTTTEVTANVLQSGKPELVEQLGRELAKLAVLERQVAKYGEGV